MSDPGRKRLTYTQKIALLPTSRRPTWSIGPAPARYGQGTGPAVYSLFYGLDLARVRLPAFAYVKFAQGPSDE